MFREFDVSGNLYPLLFKNLTVGLFSSCPNIPELITKQSMLIDVHPIKTVLKNGNCVFIPAFFFAGATGANGNIHSRRRPIKSRSKLRLIASSFDSPLKN
jgi:hypothetical protein